MRFNQGEVHYTQHDGIISSDPDLMAKLVDPNNLRHGVNFYVSDALNLLQDALWHGDEEGKEGTYGAEDGKTYSLADLKVRSELVPNSPIRAVRFVSVPGTDREGAAFVVVAQKEGKTKHFHSCGDGSLLHPGYSAGPYMRMHSACGFSEIGRKMTAQIYNDARWLLDNREELRPLFMPYGDRGMVAAYPIYGDTAPTNTCDCRAQRRLSQAAIILAGGYYVSLAGAAQEGRGYGPQVKEDAYRVEELLGCDTKRAFDVLGLNPYDIREYGHLTQFLGEIGLRRVTLLSNNDDKERALDRASIDVTRMSLVPDGISESAVEYLQAKKVWFGHDTRRKSTLPYLGDATSVRLQEDPWFDYNRKRALKMRISKLAQFVSRVKKLL